MKTFLLFLIILNFCFSQTNVQKKYLAATYLPQNVVIYETQSLPFGVDINDFNNDNIKDMLSVNLGNNSVSVFIGNGDGTFQNQVTYSVLSRPRHVSVSDFDNDGNLDLAVAHWNSGRISILIGNGDGMFQSQVNYATQSDPIGIDAGDFNNDDIVIEVAFELYYVAIMSCAMISVEMS